MLVNIFVAIILSSYDQVSKMNPDSNNASEFASMVIMQAKRTATRALGKQDRTQQSDDLEPHVLLNKMDRIEDETFWDIFEGYFTLGGHGVEAAMKEHASEVRATRRAVQRCAHARPGLADRLFCASAAGRAGGPERVAHGGARGQEAGEAGGRRQRDPEEPRAVCHTAKGAPARTPPCRLPPFLD